MDIVTRLKKYMDFKQLAISQFADTCGIPRPTISQILNGRNKKISDELIGKIHSAFPDLSVVWLMFGEGDMLINSNIKTSAPQQDKKLTFDDNQISEHEIFQSGQDLFPEITEIYSKKNDTDNSSLTIPAEITSDKTSSNITDVIAGKTELTKKITSIVVFYADNTFQTFNPS